MSRQNLARRWPLFFAVPALAACGVWTSIAQSATILYVNVSQSTGRNNGVSWTDAFQGRLGVQAALAAAVDHADSVEIWIAEGVYAPAPPDGDKSASFVLQNDVALLGGFNGTEQRAVQRDPVLHPVMFTGDLNSNDQPSGAGLQDNARHVVFATDVTLSAVLDGVTIERGSAEWDEGPRSGWGANALLVNASPTISNCTFRFGSASRGGGIAVVHGAPLFTNCMVLQNTGTDFGGGVYHVEGSTATFAGCRFEENVGGSGAGFFNGGMDAPSAPTLEQCDFIGNVGFIGAASGIGFYDDGGAPSIIMCRFHFNVTGGGGGGIYLRQSTALIRACDFVGNEALADGGGAAFIDGGGPFAPPRPGPVFADCRFNGNVGAVMSNMHGFAELLNCTITHTIPGPETFLSWPAILCTGEGELLLRNSIVYDNVPFHTSGVNAYILVIGGGALSAFDCCIEGLDSSLAGRGNFDFDPLYLAPLGADGIAGTPDDDLRLQLESPCIDTGANDGVHPRSAVDFTGLARIQDGDDDGIAIVDLGCHERAAPTLLGDLNADGAVNGADLALLLGAWGSRDDAADFTLDGVVDAQDLAVLLGAWSG